MDIIDKSNVVFAFSQSRPHSNPSVPSLDSSSFVICYL